MAYGGYCIWFMLEASWGRRGEVKPFWFETAAGLAYPGMFFPVPLIGPLLVGAAAGIGLVRLVRWVRG